MCDRIRYVENPASRNSEITERLYVSPLRNRIRNLPSAEPLYLYKFIFVVVVFVVLLLPVLFLSLSLLFLLLVLLLL